MVRKRIFLFPIVLVLATLACTMFVGGPEYPEGAIPVSAEAVESLRAQLEAAVQAGAESGMITLQITEEQITSYIAFKLASQANPALRDPQVYLRDGQMQIYGKTQQESDETQGNPHRSQFPPPYRHGQQKDGPHKPHGMMIPHPQT